jgi:DNA-binding NtrC family response regulator
MRAGAFDYLIKPVDKSRLITTIRRAFELVDMRNENDRLKEYLFKDRLERPELFDRIITRNRAMLAVFQYIEAIARTPMPVLIMGETGTGKEMIAKAVHNASARSGEFVTINIAGLNDTLFSDTLFGHERGAFTGASDRREGLVAKASDGTLFLDEIGDLSSETQIKLLRLLEDKTYYPVGSDSLRTSTARIVVATNRDLDRLREAGTFRNDLYFRLRSHLIHLPPLRERPEDIALLVDAFMEEAAGQLGKNAPALERDFYTLLESYSFPGNVRELRLMLFDAVSSAKSGILSADSIRPRLSAGVISQPLKSTSIPGHEMTKDNLTRRTDLPTLKEAEQALVDEALNRSGGNQTIAAQLLGLTRSALNKRLIRSRAPQAEDGDLEKCG